MCAFDFARERASWAYPTTIWFGAGSVAVAAKACALAGIRRPLLVTDPGLAGREPVRRTRDALQEGGLGPELFSDLRPNPTEACLAAGVRRFVEGAFDGVVAVGGGSALDLGKAIAFMAGQRRPVWDFEDVGDNWKRADESAIRPVVAIPTTAGTGSEVGRAAVLTDPHSQRKRIIFHPRMMPRLALLDPELTVELPPKLTAATGMDALAHLLEAYLAPTFHPMAEGIAVEGMRLVREALVAAYRDGRDLEARGKMLVAASMGAVAFQKGLGAVHALSHPIGARFDTHHGLTNAVLLPYVLAFNRAQVEDKLVRLARFLGLKPAGFDGVLAWLLDLREELDIPPTLAALGIDDSAFPALAEAAVVDPTAATNPRPLARDDALELYRRAFEGRI